MGIMHVTAIVRNPADLDRAWEGTFLVDTGAIDCVVPRKHLEAIGLVPLDSRVYGLADGSDVRMDVTAGVIEVYGRENGQRRDYGRRRICGAALGSNGA